MAREQLLAEVPSFPTPAGQHGDGGQQRPSAPSSRATVPHAPPAHRQALAELDRAGSDPSSMANAATASWYSSPAAVAAATAQAPPMAPPAAAYGYGYAAARSGGGGVAQLVASLSARLQADETAIATLTGDVTQLRAEDSLLRGRLDRRRRRTAAAAARRGR